MSSEDETRKLLKFREDLENRIGRLQAEVGDLRRAMAEIDRQIVRQGFRQPVPSPVRPAPSAGADSDEEDQSSVKTKDGEILGTLRVDEAEIVFEPRGDLVFVTSIPPFQSFFVERVLDNMRSADEGRVTAGEISADEILSYDVETDGERILRVAVRNYGGERRLREIQSSLRWAFEKMHEKLGQG
ncbi:MAG: hypothetical protein NWF12_03640 [Candidatus Bathyarchaeota archaeon]|nr:hypothetical protein [Candidatus Bathyarchaeota archaeon]